MINFSHRNLLILRCEEYGYPECYIAYWMWRILPLIFITVGTVGNVLNILVLTSKNLRQKSASVYLMFLACSDLTSIWTGMFNETIYSLFEIKIVDLSAVTCGLIEWLIYTAGVFSVWLLTLVTIERVLSTKVPHLVKGRLTPTKSVTASTIVLLFAACLCGHLVYGNEYIGGFPYQVGNMTVYVPGECTHRSKTYSVFYNNTWAHLLSFFGTFLPTSIIISGNIVIIVSLRNRKIAPNSLTEFAQARVQITLRQQAKLLFALSVTLLLATISFSTYRVILDYTATGEPRTLARFQLYTICAYSAVWMNFSCNFILYCMTGVLFRREWKKIFHGIKARIFRQPFVCVKPREDERVGAIDI